MTVLRPASFLKLSLVFCLVPISVSGAWAVTDEEIFRDLRFNLINPGARALGMGGAFIAIANDATAAQSNPAGMTNLANRPQLFFELRYANPDSTSTQVDFQFPQDPNSGFSILAATEPKTTTAPSFVSYVQPFLGEKLFFGVSRQEVLNNKNRTVNVYNVIAPTTLTSGPDVRTAEGAIDLAVVAWNVSLGWKIIEKFRIGVTASYSQFAMNSSVVNTFVDPTGAILNDPTLVGVPIEMYRTTVDANDSDFTFAAGLLWQIVRGLTFGATYHQGGQFNVDERLEAQNIDPNLIPGAIASRVFFNETNTILTDENRVVDLPMRFSVPKQYGAGLSYRPIPSLTIAVDADKIFYSDLLRGFNSRLNLLTVFWESDQEAAFTIDDVVNLHAGIEYELPARPGGTTGLIRGGWYQDKDSQLRSKFAPGGIGLASNNQFPGRNDVDHYSAGGSVVIKNRVQLDFGADFSQVGTEVVASFTYQF